MSEMTTGGVAPPPPPPGPRRRSGSGCLLSGMLLLAAVLVLGFLGLAAFLFIGEGPTVPEGSILLVGTEGEYPETLQYAPFLFADAGPSFSELVQGLSAAASDPRIAGLHLRVGRTRLGWARARELRDGVLRFREAGKRVTASLEYAGLMDYYLASAADRIHMHPRGQLGLYGVSMEVMFFAGLFEKLGIEAQFEAIGPYKTAPEAFTASGMSPEHRDQLESLGEEFRSGAAEAVAGARGMTAADADRLLSDGPYTASRALEEGLVDALSYLDEIEEDVGDEELVDIGDYVGSLRRGAARAEVRVAVIHVDGAILPGQSREDLSAGRVAGANTVAEALAWAEEEASVDAVVLRVSSPGGSDSASDTIWRAAERVRAVKPLVASFGDVAASGGYWVSTAARRVVAEPLSITGSIGVYVGKFNIGELLDKIGIAADLVTAGGRPNWLSPSRPLDEQDLERLREGAAETYGVFLERVAASREMTTTEVDAIGQGRVFTGGQALAAGLVDQAGGIEDAVRLAASEAGFPDDATIEWVSLPEPPTLAEAIEAEFRAGGLRARLPLLDAALEGTRLALLPFVPEFR